MSLFQHNVNTDVLIAIEYTNVLYSCNYAAESIVYELSQKKFGSVTLACKDILKRVANGKTLQAALMEEKNHVSSKNMQLFISALGSETGVDVSQRLTDLGKHIVAEKKLSVESFISNIKSKLNKILILLIIPLIVYFLVELSTETFIQFEQFTSLTPTLKNTIYIGVLIADVIILAFFLMSMRYKE